MESTSWTRSCRGQEESTKRCGTEGDWTRWNVKRTCMKKRGTRTMKRMAEEEHQKVRAIVSLDLPSGREVCDRNLTHNPFRSSCGHNTRGRGRRSAYKSSNMQNWSFLFLFETVSRTKFAISPDLQEAPDS